MSAEAIIIIAVAPFLILAGMTLQALLSESKRGSTPEEDDEQANTVNKSERIGLYNWNGTPSEGDYYVLVDGISEDQRQAM